MSRQRTPQTTASPPERDPRPRVVIASLAHPSYDDVRVFQKEARTLAAHGYAVTLYAQAPGRIGPFDHDAIRVIPLDIDSRMNLVAQLPRLTRRLLAEDAAVYHCHNPFTLPLVLALKAAGRTVIYDVHEDYRRRIRLRTWLPRPFRPLAGTTTALLEHVAGRWADAAIASQPDVAERLGPDTLLLLNAPQVDGPVLTLAADFAAALPEAEVHPDGALRLVYAGGISRARGLFGMLDALARIRATRPARLWLLGYADDDDLADARRHPAWGAVDFLGALPQPEAFGYIARADVALATLLDEGGHADASPNKLYEYMAMGTPFVASDFAFWKDGQPAATGGYYVDPADPDAIARAVLRLAEDPDEATRLAERGRAYVRDTFNWTHEQAKLLALYDRLIGPQAK